MFKLENPQKKKILCVTILKFAVINSRRRYMGDNLKRCKMVQIYLISDNMVVSVHNLLPKVSKNINENVIIVEIF